MVTESNVNGMARLLIIVVGGALVAWGLWGAAKDWTQWIWLALGGVFLVLGLIGYSPVHAWFREKARKEG